MKRKVQKIGINKTVLIREVDNTELLGKIIAINADSFTIAEDDVASATTIHYTDHVSVLGTPKQVAHQEARKEKRTSALVVLGICLVVLAIPMIVGI